MNKILVLDRHFDYVKRIIPGFFSDEGLLPASLITNSFISVYYKNERLKKYELEDPPGVIILKVDDEINNYLSESDVFDLHFDGDCLSEHAIREIHQEVTGERNDLVFNPCFDFEFGEVSIDSAREAINKCDRMLLCELLSKYQYIDVLKTNYPLINEGLVLNYAESLAKWCVNTFADSHQDFEEIVLINNNHGSGLFKIKDCINDSGLKVSKFDVSKMSLDERLKVWSELNSKNFFISSTHAGAGYLMPVLKFLKPLF